MALVQDGKPAPALVKLAQRHGIEVSDDVSASKLSEATQGLWLRQASHQYQIPGGPPTSEDLALLSELTLVEEITAPFKFFIGVLLLGALAAGVRRRLAYLVEQYWRKADSAGRTVKFTDVFLLGGARPLDKEKENALVLCTPTDGLPFKKGWTPPATMPTTEAGMMQLVFEQSDLPPWKGELIDTPRQPTADGRMRDPNASDTARMFYKERRWPGTYLCVSSQPFVARHTLNIERELPASFHVVGIGCAALTTTPLKTYLDEVARLLFEELQPPTKK